MRRLVVASTLVLTLALPAAVSAHPSETRNPNGFGEGPHCHTVQASGTTAFPSHQAHDSQNTHHPRGVHAIFIPVTCPA